MVDETQSLIFSLNITDILAILGALAWLPPIGSCLKKIIQKPVVRIMAPLHLEVGYTFLGQILNPHFAFIVENKDFVITAMSVTLEHQNGDRKTLQWQSIEESLMQVEQDNGISTPYKKNSEVLVLKLSRNSASERQIRFRCNEFNQKRYERELAIRKKVMVDLDQSKYDPEHHMRSPDLMDLTDYIGQNFPWKEGEYKVTINIESFQSFKLLDNTYSFVLTMNDIKQLEANKSLMPAHYGMQLEEFVGQPYTQLAWNWAYPRFIKA